MNNIYQKINNIKQDFLNKKIKKTGKNSYSGFEYYELSDITPALIDLMNKYKVYSYISFNNELAKITLVNIENTQETITMTSPMVTPEIKGANGTQQLGGAITYLRRYLYLIAFDIVEPDFFDKTMGQENKENELATLNQLATIDKLMLDKKAICDAFKIDNIQKLTKQQASQIISKKMVEKGGNNGK